MKIWNQKFSEVYKELRKQGKVKSKRHLGRILGTYSHRINNIIKGKGLPTVDQLRKLTNHFKLDANYFFGKSEEMFIKEPLPRTIDKHKDIKKVLRSMYKNQQI